MGYEIVSRPPDDPVEMEVAGALRPVPCVVQDINGGRIFLAREALTDYQLSHALADGVGVVVDLPTMRYALIEELSAWFPYADGMTAVEMELGADLEPVASGPRTEFVHLHTHSEFSPLDGLSKIDEIVAAVTRDGNPALAITDHGTCAAHPELQLKCDAAGIKPIFGIEAYFVDDRFDRESREYYHLCLWAMNDEGLRNLWALSTESYRTGFYGKPRIDWKLLEHYSAGILASTACLAGPLARPFLKGDTERAVTNLVRLKEIFGDRLYIELHANQLPDQIKVNVWSIEQSLAYDIPLLAAVDSHYAEPEHKHDHRVWLSIQTNKDANDEVDDDGLFGGNQDYHVMPRDEVAKTLAYLGQFAEIAMANTVELANRCTARMVPKSHNPIFSRATAEHPDRVAHDVARLRAMCEEEWENRTVGKRESQEVYRARYEREIGLLIEKGFCGYFLMVAEAVRWAKASTSPRVLVGPGRGSGGGSLVAYLCRITEIDPVDRDLLFERFLTDGRVSLPDFDIDFPSTCKQYMIDHAKDRWGEDHVAAVGTHLRLQSKGVIKDVAKALKSSLPENHWPDIERVNKIITEAEAGTAGLGLTWEDLWVQVGDQLEPYRQKYPEVFEYAGRLHGRLKTYGAHAAGIIIDPDEPLTGALPLRRSDDGRMVTQFDMEALEPLGFVKFDFLNLRTLDTLYQTLLLIEEQIGEWVDPYAWDIELDDPEVFEEISQGWTLGMFQVETETGTRMCKRFKPRSVDEIKDVITLVRPGPARSGLTETFLRRREGSEPVTLPDPRLEPVLAKVLGCILYQENVMATVMVLAGYGSDEADAVRKILGKKKIDKVRAEGEKFIDKATELGMARPAAQELWAQMAEFAKYSFGEAHAFAYALLCYWTAWFKVHYPVQFLTALLSTIKEDERIPDFIEEARRMGYRVLPPDVNESNAGFTAAGVAIRYGLQSLKGVGPAATQAILEARQSGPYVSFDDFRERATGNGSKCHAGHVKVLAKAGAFDTLEPNRRGLQESIRLAEEASSGTDVCLWKEGAIRPIRWLPKPLTRAQREEYEGLVANHGEGSAEVQAFMRTLSEPAAGDLPCAYPWMSEPDEINEKNGRKKARKAPPKRCTRGCRQFAPAELPGRDSFEPYTDEEIQKIEMEMFGVYLTSTPFDKMPAEVKAELSTGVDILLGDNGDYMLAAVVRSVRRHTIVRSGDTMAFVSVLTEQGKLDVTVFPKLFTLFEEDLVPGSFLLLAVEKNDRGISLQHAAVPGEVTHA